MSSVDLAADPVPDLAPNPVRGHLRFVAAELRLVFGRRRNQALLAALAAVPVVLGIAVRVANGRRAEAGGPGLLGDVTSNGIFLAFTALVVVLPVFLPLAVSVVAGDAVAGEAGAGTLRYLLVVPVSRTRLLVVKYLGILCYALAAALLVAVVGVLVGAALFPSGPVTLLSGTTVSYLQGLGRTLAIAGYVGAMLAGVAAIGLFISTLTEVPIAAMAATAVVPVLSQVLDVVPQISWLHPWLPSHRWFAFADLLRDPVQTSAVGRGLLAQAGYVAVFGALAWARLTSRDISS